MLRDIQQLGKLPYFNQLFIARSISNFGNGISPVALAFGVLAIEGSNAVSLSQVMFARTFPIVLLLIVGGAIADRYGRARVMGWSDIWLSSLIMIAAISFIIDQPSVRLLVVVGLLSGVLNGIWYPAFAGIVPIVVPKEKLQSAFAAIAFGSNLMFMLGTAAGGFIVSFFGVGWALAIDAITFFIAGVLILPLRKLPQKGLLEEGQSSNMLKDIKEGWSEFSSRSWLVTVVLAFLFVNMAYEATYAVLGPLQANDSYNGASSWATMLGTLTFGMLVGVVIANKLRPKHPLIVAMLASFFVGIWILTLALSLPLWIILIFAFLAGVGFDIFFVLWMTTLQTNIPEESLSRVNAYDAFGTYLFGPIGMAIAGPLVLIIGIKNTLLIGGVIAIVAVASTFLMPSVRKLESKV